MGELEQAENCEKEETQVDRIDQNEARTGDQSVVQEETAGCQRGCQTRISELGGY